MNMNISRLPHETEDNDIRQMYNVLVFFLMNELFRFLNNFSKKRIAQ